MLKNNPYLCTKAISLMTLQWQGPPGQWIQVIFRNIGKKTRQFAWEKPSKKGREQTPNSFQSWQRVWESNPCHSGDGACSYRYATRAYDLASLLEWIPHGINVVTLKWLSHSLYVRLCCSRHNVTVQLLCINITDLLHLFPLIRKPLYVMR